jgi:hypothetical protein
VDNSLAMVYPQFMDRRRLVYAPSYTCYFVI